MIGKIAKWFGISVGIIIVLIISLCFIIAYFYGDEVKSYVVTEVNKHLKTEIQVKDIDFSLFKKFPNASVELIDVTAKSTEDFKKKDFINVNTDTLFTAKSIFLQFNILNIINKKYKLKTIDIEKGQLNIFIDRKGNDNYHFWISDESTDSSAFKLELKKLIFNRVTLRFFNAAKGLHLKTYTNYLALAGDFASEQYELSTNGVFKIDDFYYNNTSYFNSRKAELDLNLYVNNDNYSVKSGVLMVEDLKFLISGRYNTTKDYLDLKVSGTDLDITSFLSVLPATYKKDINDFSSSGRFYFASDIKGELSHAANPHIEINFGVENGTIERNNTRIKLKSVFLKGKYSNGSENTSSTSYLLFENFKALMGESFMEGKYKMENFNHPLVEINASANIDLADFQEFFKIDTIEYLGGELSSDFHFQGKINDFNNLTVEDFRNAKTDGKIFLKNCNFRILNNPYEFSSVNGDFSFNNNDIEIHGMDINVNGSDFNVKGYFNNILSYFLVEDQQLSVTGQIISKSVDIDKLFGIEGLSENNSESYRFPDNVAINANVDIELFKFGRFVAENVFGKIIYKNKTLAATPLTFKTMNGELKATGTIEQAENNNFITKTYVTLKKIDITKLFYSFSNFGQDFIQDKHLKGNISATVSYSSVWDDKLVIDESSVFAESNIEIENGELVNFEPMEKLSKFIALEELMNLKFATLKNEIIISGREVKIPLMNINSSAIDIELSGTHTFDNAIDYKVKLLLSDLLASKAKKAKKENEEFGEIEDDGLGKTSIYISITGTVDDYKISYDTKNVIIHIKESFQEEKKNLKVILNEEFGLFKKDSAVIKAKEIKEKEEPKNNIKFYWSEDKDSTETNEDIEEEDDW